MEGIYENIWLLHSKNHGRQRGYILCGILPMHLFMVIHTRLKKIPHVKRLLKTPVYQLPSIISWLFLKVGVYPLNNIKYKNIVKMYINSAGLIP